MPFPHLKTERLFLRELRESDWRMILYLRSSKLVNKFIRRPKAESQEDAVKFINKIKKGIDENELLYWSITLKDNPELIGTICIWNFSEDKKVAEVGYELSSEFYKQGIMNEALICVIDFGFNILKLNKIEAYTHKENEGSTKLLLKNNFKINGDRIDKNNVDNIIFEIINSDS